MKTILKSSAFAAILLTAPAAFAGLIVGAPVDVVGNLPLATFVGNNFATQSYKEAYLKAVIGSCIASDDPRLK